MEQFSKHLKTECTGAEWSTDEVSAGDIQVENSPKQELTAKEMTANIQALRSYLAFLKDDPNTPVEDLAETEGAIERTNVDIKHCDSEARAKALAKWGYTGYED